MAKTQQEQDRLIAISNDLVLSCYSFNLWEFRLFFLAIQDVKRSDKVFRPFKFYAKIVKQFFKNKSNGAYKKIVDACSSLQKKQLVVNYNDSDGDERQKTINIFSLTDKPRNENSTNKYLFLKFNDDVMPYLLNLIANYTLFDIRNILNLRCSASFRLYQIFKMKECNFKDEITFDLPVDFLRKMMIVDSEGEPVDKYSRYSDFKNFALTNPYKQINQNTDVKFKFVELKKGKTIDKIRFTIYKNIPLKLTVNQSIKESKSYQLLLKNGVTESMCLDICKNQEDKFIIFTLNKCIEDHMRKSKNNLAGYIVSSIKNGLYIVEYKNRLSKIEASKVKKLKLQELMVQDSEIQKYLASFKNLLKSTISITKENLSNQEIENYLSTCKRKYPLQTCKTDPEIMQSIFFDFVVQENIKEFSTFEIWMKHTHNLEVLKCNDTNLYLYKK